MTAREPTSVDNDIFNCEVKNLTKGGERKARKEKKKKEEK